MEDITKKTDIPETSAEPVAEVEMPTEAPVEKTETRELKPLPIWLVLIIVVLFIVLLGTNYNACSNIKNLEKAGIESKNQFDSLAKKTKEVESDLSDTKASLSELNDVFQDSLDKVNNPEWFRVADSLAFEYSQKKEGKK